MYTLPNSPRHLKKGHVLSLNGKAYTIQCVIGEGGQCIVYEATTPDEIAGIDRTVIIRELFPRKSDIERKENGELVFPQGTRELWLEQFKSEYKKHAAITEKIRSAFIRPDAYAELNNTAYMIFATPENAVSFDRKFSKCSLRFTIKILSKVTSIVADLHKEHMVHADLKPANILLLNLDMEKEDCEVRLLDCGGMINLSKPKDSVYISYTQEYAAPEIKHGITDRISPASDVYSIAAILAAKLGIPAEEFTGKVEYCDIGIHMRYNAFTLLNTILSYNLAIATRARDSAAYLSQQLDTLYRDMEELENNWINDERDYPKLLHEAFLLKKNISENAADKYLEKYKLVKPFSEKYMKFTTDEAWRCFQRGDREESVFFFTAEENLAKSLNAPAEYQRWRMHDFFAKVLANTDQGESAHNQRILADALDIGEAEKVDSYANALNYPEERFAFDYVANEAERVLKQYSLYVNKSFASLTWLKLMGKQGQNLMYMGKYKEAQPVFDDIKAFLTTGKEFDGYAANRKQSLGYIMHYYLEYLRPEVMVGISDLTPESIKANRNCFLELQEDYFECKPFVEDSAEPDVCVSVFLTALDKLRCSDAESNLPYLLYTMLKAAYRLRLGKYMDADDMKTILKEESTNCTSYHPYQFIQKYKFLLAVQGGHAKLAEKCLKEMENPHFADIGNVDNCGVLTIVSTAALCECAKAADWGDRFKGYYGLLRSKIEQAQVNNTIIQGYFDRLDDPAQTLKKFRYMYA